MIPRSLMHLLTSAPSWVNSEIIGPGIVRLCTQPPRPSGLLGPMYNLVLRMDNDGEIVVAEAKLGEALPVCCPERHINPDGSFCVHLNSTAQIKNAETARLWWGSLRAFLLDQEYAARHRSWPLHSQLSHGDAAAIQLEMEAIAEPLGWVEEVHLGIFRREGWLGSALPKVRVRKGEAGPVPNARSPCPRGCSRRGRKIQCLNFPVSLDTKSEIERAILRAECPERASVESLIRLEHGRRYLEKKMMDALTTSGIGCCGTMDHCALAVAHGHRRRNPDPH